MAQRDPDVAGRGAVREIPLEPGPGELVRERAQETRRDLEVALTVLEADRVDLVWHGRRPHRLVVGPLLEEAHGEVQPEVPIQIDEDVRHLAGQVQVLTPRVVVLDLGGGPVGLEAQAADEALGESDPVVGREHRDERRPVPRGAVELAPEAEPREPLVQPQEALDVHRDLLARGRGRRLLTVGPGGHRRRGQGRGHVPQRPDERAQGGELLLLAIGIQHQAEGQVVHVLRGQPEVDPVGIRQRELLPQEELHGLHVVAGGLLDGLDALEVPVVEVSDDVLDRGLAIRREGGPEPRLLLGEEVGALDLCAGLHERELREELAQVADLGRIATVEG